MIVKTCSRCKEEKPEDAYPSKGRRCRACCAKVTAEWYAKKAQNEGDRRAIQKYRNGWHRNKLRTDPDYREKHLNQRRKRHAERWSTDDAHREKETKRVRDRYATAPGRARFLLMQARMRDPHCTLELDDVLPLMEAGSCPRTGFKFDLSPHAEHHRNPLSPSIDRVDGTKGYLKGNIQIVCSWYNIAKNEYTDAQMLAFCRAVVDANPKTGV